MKAIVFGAGGMLGAALADLMRRDPCDIEVVPFTHATVDIADVGCVFEALTAHQDADVAFNCAGVLNTASSPVDMVRANALGPHVLAAATKAFGMPLVHVSTDCVFSGRIERWPIMRPAYSTISPPDPADLYGRTKLAGEVEADHVTVVRASFVGPAHGLWAWVEEQIRNEVEVEGWTKALWSGSTVWAVADGLLGLVSSNDPHVLDAADEQDGGFGFAFCAPPGGILHLATKEPITKYEAIDLIAHYIGGPTGASLQMRKDATVIINRSLWPTHELPSLQDALALP